MEKIINTVAIFGAPLIAAFITFILAKYSENKPKLVAYRGYISAHRLTTPLLSLNTHGIVIRNSGNIPIKNVRIQHSFLPDYSVWPNTAKYEEVGLPSGGKELFFPILVPNEQITISYIYFPPITFANISTDIKSDDSFAEIINLIPDPNISAWQKWTIYILSFVGGSTIIYFLVIFLASLYKCLHCTS